MIRSVSIEINPSAVGDRLRKRASEAVEENRHDDAFIMSLAADVIRSLIAQQGKQE